MNIKSFFSSDFFFLFLLEHNVFFGEQKFKKENKKCRQVNKESHMEEH